MAWDENSKIYVAEMLDYPMTRLTASRPPSRVAFSKTKTVTASSTPATSRRQATPGQRPYALEGGLIVGTAPKFYSSKTLTATAPPKSQVLYSGLPSIEAASPTSNSVLITGSTPPTMAPTASHQARPERRLPPPAAPTCASIHHRRRQRIRSRPVWPDDGH
jgi:hypothetical protein